MRPTGVHEGRREHATSNSEVQKPGTNCQN